jgi:acetyltransferase-like isoleucine patch superfamily enzyme
MKKFLGYLRNHYRIGGARLVFLSLFRLVCSLIRFYSYRIVGLKGKASFIGQNFKIDFPSGLRFNGGSKIGNNVKIVGRSISKSIIGPQVSIGDFSIIFLSSSSTSFGNGFEIGSGSACAEYCIFGAAGGLKIGSNVIIGQNVRIHAENHEHSNKHIPIKEQGVNRKGIIINDDVWIGSGAVILDGVEIGSGCIIGANAVVTKTTDQFGVYAGIPAQLIRYR